MSNVSDIFFLRDYARILPKGNKMHLSTKKSKKKLYFAFTFKFKAEYQSFVSTCNIELFFLDIFALDKEKYILEFDNISLGIPIN